MPKDTRQMQMKFIVTTGDNKERYRADTPEEAIDWLNKHRPPLDGPDKIYHIHPIYYFE